MLDVEPFENRLDHQVAIRQGRERGLAMDAAHCRTCFARIEPAALHLPVEKRPGLALRRRERFL